MTGEELSKLITERNEDVAKNDIPKVVNPIMDIYQKGFDLGMDVGKELVIDKACSIFKHYLWSTVEIPKIETICSSDAINEEEMRKGQFIDNIVYKFKRTLEE